MDSPNVSRPTDPLKCLPLCRDAYSLAWKTLLEWSLSQRITQKRFLNWKNRRLLGREAANANCMRQELNLFENRRGLSMGSGGETGKKVKPSVFPSHPEPFSWLVITKEKGLKSSLGQTFNLTHPSHKYLLSTHSLSSPTENKANKVSL